jgi:thioredoxin reductase
VTVVVLGGGPAGLAAAIELHRFDTREVLVVERESHAGGIPRHAQHQGFGIRDLRRPLAGPAYARRYARLAAEAGAEVRTETMSRPGRPEGRSGEAHRAARRGVDPDAVILATGCAAAALGTARAEVAAGGVMTTGTLQQLVYLKKLGG